MVSFHLGFNKLGFGQATKAKGMRNFVYANVTLTLNPPLFVVNYEADLEDISTLYQYLFTKLNFPKIFVPIVSTEKSYENLTRSDNFYLLKEIYCFF